jgi:hypothetical protein
MARHLQEAAVELPLLADEHRVDRRLHVVVDAAPRSPREEREGAIVRVEQHLLALARVRPHKQHPAVAEAHLRHLRHCRHTVDDNDLVAPVELVRLPRRERQRHIGIGLPRAARALPQPRVAAHRVVAADIAAELQLLVHAHEGQPVAPRLALVAFEQPIKHRRMGPEPRPRLRGARVAMLRCVGPNDLAHRIAGHPQLARDRLDLLSLNEIRPPDSPDRVHRQHPPVSPLANQPAGRLDQRGWGQNWTPITPQQGSKLHADSQAHTADRPMSIKRRAIRIDRNEEKKFCDS